MTNNKDPLHGITLQMMLTELHDNLGWEGLSEKININCFKSNPSIKSSLTFLRRTPWAREKVERLYLKSKGVKLARKPLHRETKSETSGSYQGSENPWDNASKNLKK